MSRPVRLFDPRAAIHFPIMPQADKRLPNETFESYSERLIREAERRGDFRNLPGAGKKLAAIDEPYDENWWIRQKLQDENINVLPPILAARREIEVTLEAIQEVSSEYRVRQILIALNKRVRAALLAPQPGPAVPVFELDVERTIAKWKSQRCEE